MTFHELQTLLNTSWEVTFLDEREGLKRCPVCGAAVYRTDEERHRRWHEWLHQAISLAGL